jgi:hypothetical protein
VARLSNGRTRSGTRDFARLRGAIRVDGVAGQAERAAADDDAHRKVRAGLAITRKYPP